MLLRSPDLGRDHPTAAMQNPLAADRTSWGRKGGRCCGRPLLWAAEGTLATLRCLVDFWPRAPRDLNPRPSGKTLTVCEYHWPWVLLVGKMRHLRLSVRRTPNQIATQTAIVYNWILHRFLVDFFSVCRILKASATAAGTGKPCHKIAFWERGGGRGRGSSNGGSANTGA